MVPMTERISREAAKPKSTANPKIPLPTANRFNEDERRDIFRMLVEAEDRAHEEADVAIPADVDSTASMDDATQTATLNANTELTNNLIEKYKSDVYQQFRLSKKEQELIENEGAVKNWASL